MFDLGYRPLQLPQWAAIESRIAEWSERLTRGVQRVWSMRPIRSRATVDVQAWDAVLVDSTVTRIRLPDARPWSGAEIVIQRSAGTQVIALEPTVKGQVAAGYTMPGDAKRIHLVSLGSDGWLAWSSDAASGGGVVTARQVIAGAGLTGGGDLSADRTLNVAAGDSSISVAADSITVGVISDAQHGSRGGGSLHPDVTDSVSGFMSALQKIALDALIALVWPTKVVETGADSTGTTVPLPLVPRVIKTTDAGTHDYVWDIGADVLPANCDADVLADFTVHLFGTGADKIPYGAYRISATWSRTGAGSLVFIGQTAITDIDTSAHTYRPSLQAGTNSADSHTIKLTIGAPTAADYHWVITAKGEATYFAGS